MSTLPTPTSEPPFADLLRNDLISGKYSPGEWLKQADLESRYSANRFEVRMVLSELHIRGLLEHIPNKGYRVCDHTDQERENLYEVRTLWEMAAARLIVQRVKEEQIREFERMAVEFDRAIETEQQDMLRELNGALHRYFYSMTGNPLMAEQIENLRERGLPGRKGHWNTVKSIRSSSGDHLEMVEMLKRRDADGLAAVIHRHLNRWRKQSKPYGE